MERGVVDGILPGRRGLEDIYRADSLQRSRVAPPSFPLYRQLGEPGADCRKVEFGIDSIAPELRILTANGTLFPKGDALLALEGWDNESMLISMAVSVDGRTVYQGPFMETLELPDLPAGEMVVTVQVVDASGNEALETTSMTVGALPAEPGVNGVIFLLGSAVFLLIIILVIQLAMSRKTK